MGPFQWFHQYYRCPASNDCTGISQSELKSSRSPQYDYPISLEDSSRMMMLNVSMRAEPDTDMETCCVNNEAMGWKCDPDNCQRRIQNDETALSTDVDTTWTLMLMLRLADPS